MVFYVVLRLSCVEAGKSLSLIFLFCFCFLNLSAEGEVKRNQSLSDALCPEMLQVRKEENKKYS